MASAKRLGYAVVGLGGIAQRAVLPAFAHSKKAALISVVSGDARKAGKFAKKFGAHSAYTYEDLDQCLAEPGVDAVYLASPNGCHSAQTLRAAAAGKHVLCEKPMANTVDECRQMIEACRRENVRLMIAYRKYFEPASLALKKLITSGKLGPLRVIHSAFTIFIPPDRPTGWHFDPALAGGGALPDVGVYCVNTVRWLTGLEPERAAAYAWITDRSRFNDSIDQHVAFRLIFPGGLVLQAAASFGADKASFLHLHGEKGWAALDPAFAYDEERRLFGKVSGRRFERAFPLLDEFALELDALADAVAAGRNPEPDGVQGMRDVAVMQAIYEAARERREVAIEMPA
ncbi:MAG: Gfo/Idh/MocA family protein [Terriglobia bacterium]